MEKIMKYLFYSFIFIIFVGCFYLTWALPKVVPNFPG
jgi:hypothetical protein